MRVAIKVAYLGDPFCGSQIQPSCRTVEGEILSIFHSIMEGDVDLRASSRTDKGVNALGNVFALTCALDPMVAIGAFNRISTDIKIGGFAIVSDDFNPRHAEMRHYRYMLRYDGHDLDSMVECSKEFVGGHDFVNFCKFDGRDTNACIDSIRVEREGNAICFDFFARFYLWNMIRRIVAAISEVGLGRRPISDIQGALNGRSSSFGLAPSEGLTLMDVSYPGVGFQHVDFDRRSIDDELFKTGLKELFLKSVLRL